jgi:Mn-dependent DtxR family transcriptional regulator
MARYMHWQPAIGAQVADLLLRRGLVTRQNDGTRLALTETGRALARDVMVR